MGTIRSTTGKKDAENQDLPAGSLSGTLDPLIIHRWCGRRVGLFFVIFCDSGNRKILPIVWWGLKKVLPRRAWTCERLPATVNAWNLEWITRASECPTGLFLEFFQKISSLQARLLAEF
jgi:hypothetical protein